MTADRQSQIKRLCEDALERPSSERDRYLEEACGGDATLRREVEALLAYDVSADRFLAMPAFEMEAEQLAVAAAGARKALVGSRLGTYEILSLIGSGGMGEVYRAHDAKLRRDVAIKLLPSFLANDPDRLARLEREARLLAALNHPHIATIYGLEDADGIRALVMELVEGPTLAEKLAHGTRRRAAAALPLTDALDIARQLTEALAAAHDKGIVHRDLKPANIKIGPDGRVKVLDFGLAKAVSNEFGGAAMSQLATSMATDLHPGVIAGTPAYMSPEQARGLAVDTRADIWAFGCVLFEMLTGRKAFSGETVSDTIASILEREPDWNALPAATPPNFRHLLAHCLEKDPARRWRDIGDVRIALDDVERAPAVSGVARTVSRARERTAWAAALVLVTGAAALAMLRVRDRPVVAQPIRFQIPATVNLATSGNLAVSPDGRNLAFIGVGADGAIRLWLRAMDSLELRPLPGSEMATVGPPFFWSPDSRSIAFDAGGTLKRIAIAGGPPQTLCALPGVAVGGSWNRTGDIIVASTPGGLLRVSDTGGIPTAVTALDSSRNEQMHLMPTFLSDGRHFVYLRVSRTTPDKSGIYVGTLDARPEAQSTQALLPYAPGLTFVPATESQPGRLLFLRDDALMTQPLDERRLALGGDPVVIAQHVGSYLDTGFFSASANGILVYRTVDRDLQIAWFDRQGGLLGAVSDAAQFHSMALSPDGSRAVVSRTNPQETATNDLWVIDLARDNTTTRFTFEGGVSGDAPVWSPDGTRIAYSLGEVGLFEKQSSGTKDSQILVPATGGRGLVAPCGWSPDGRFFLYAETTATTRWDLWIKTSGDRMAMPFARTRFDEDQGRFAPDGRWVAYVSNESGVSEVYVREFTGDFSSASSSAGAGILVSKGGGASPRWRADGKELFYVAPGRRMMAVDVSGAGAFRSGTPHVLFQVPPGAIGGDVTPDGRRFLLATPLDRNASAPFTVVLNWTASLN